MKIGIILVNFCQPELTIECINSIKRSSYKEYIIYVIDNNSGDRKSYDFLNEIVDEKVKVIFSEENNGFSAGNNIGIKAALEEEVEYVLLLNNDTVIDENMIENMLKEANSTTILSPKMYYYDEPKKIWYAGGKIDRLRGTFNHIGTDKIDVGQYDNVMEIPVTTGCCMLIPSEIINEIGLLDESFFMYAEDTEYSLRVTNAGYKIKYIPEAKLWHKVSSSSNPKSKEYIYYSNRNRFYVAKQFGFGKFAQIYTFVTRILYLLYGYLCNDNYKYIKRAYLDYKNGVKGKVEL